MIHKTRGLVLNYIKYRETSIIARIYTEKFGLQSYIINSVRSQKSKKGLALVQPLTLLDMVVYHNDGKASGLQRISEYKPSIHFCSIPFDVKKSSIALFITELLSNVLKEEEHHGAVFDFLFKLVARLDEESDAYENIHLYLLVQLTHYIGFGIHTTEELARHTIVNSVSSDYTSIYETIIDLNNMEIDGQIKLSNALRRDVLAYLVEYYVLHIEGFKSLKSLDVLSQVFK